jgi:hypothetical protein
MVSRNGCLLTFLRVTTLFEIPSFKNNALHSNEATSKAKECFSLTIKFCK